MLNKNEITALSLSPTKKDFVQIWNELLEVAGKLSERWDPTSTNESDPGIVILKALTGIADKLNYTIDKNILEAFMPTASQEDSMRKLCEMLGYTVKYYRSAETNVTIKYHNAEPSEDEATAMSGLGQLLPKFTVITNGDKDISYFTTNQTPYYISKAASSITVPCMEGQIVKCESTADNNVITAAQLSETNRFYLPEAQIAENGIFVYNVASVNTFDNEVLLSDGTPWEKVDNLNIQAHGSRVFKFGYDSYESRPYIEFPNDYSELINDGLFIYYARTSGANGNISAKTLTQLEKPNDGDWSKIAAESFTIENAFAATSGANIETIKQAYNNFKKTIGTFDTLVTCRDYMNKIYTMVNDVNKPLVSNILVTDIRNDLNRAVTICSSNDAGIFYKETPLTTTSTKTFKKASSYEAVEVEFDEPAIDHFDLVFYPFKSYTQIKNNVKDIQETYDSSFRYNTKSFDTVLEELNRSNVKTIAHNIIPPRKNDLISINNYLRLNAIIGTNSKITIEEGDLLKETIKIALANAFNMRELDFGEEIPFESIVEVIEKADSRIKVVSLNEPALYTTFSVYEGTDDFKNAVVKEYAVASDWLTEAGADVSGRFEIEKEPGTRSVYSGTFDSSKARTIYNKLAVRNVLAGRVPLFNYNEKFKTNFTEGPYSITQEITFDDLPASLKDKPLWASDKLTPAIEVISNANSPDVIYTKQVTSNGTVSYTETHVPNDYATGIIGTADDIDEIQTSCIIPFDQSATARQISDVTLTTGEFVRFRAPNFITTTTYPAYVNYHLRLNENLIAEAENARAAAIFDLLDTDAKKDKVLSYFTNINKKSVFTLTQKISKVSNAPVIDNPLLEPDNECETILKRSGFVKVKVNADNQANPIFSASTPDFVKHLTTLNIAEQLGGKLFIEKAETFENIISYVNSVLTDALNANSSINFNEWTIAYEFEYVPFESSTLGEWENFVNLNSNAADLWGFTVEKDAAVVLWRVYSEEAYSKGKYILSDGSKLMPFTSSYFNTLDNIATNYNRLQGVYIASSLGKDQKPHLIDNNEEYELADGEYLFIEYTPSTTTEDGTTQTSEPVKEIKGPGEIIKPSGFETGLYDSTVYAASHSALKSLDFTLPNGTKTNVALFSLGANEQIELREKAKVELNKNAFSNSAVIYVYKNFNNCKELEEVNSVSNKRVNNKYTLKDGEYIFYTDQNQTELAYFTTGTEVTLKGKAKLPKFEVIDLATIFDSGIQEIPWYRMTLTSSADTGEADAIEFQEYQYLTLESGDTLNELSLTEAGTVGLDENWHYCNHVYYTTAGSNAREQLPKITLSTDNPSVDKGCGWEACSILELNVSPNTTQILRNIPDKIQTSIQLLKNNDTIKTLTAEDANHPLAFKTNLSCQSSNGKIKVENVYNNPDNIKNFELKVFSENAPSVLKVHPTTLVPIADLDQNEGSIAVVEYDDTWSQVELNKLSSGEEYFNKAKINYDRALKLTANILPETYGIFSIYLKYDYVEKDSWIELMPGVSAKDTLELFSLTKAEAERAWDTTTSAPRLMLKPGLNCIKINTTCDIFIKTESGSQGTLCFDTLRLVNTPLITYTEGGSTKTVRSRGLNLSQIGYLDATENTDNIFDNRIREQLKADYVDEALSKLDTEEQLLTDQFNAKFNEILQLKGKANNIVTLLESAKSEIDALSALNLDADSKADYEGKVSELILHFNDLKADLDKELELKAALETNADIDILEQQLTDLLDVELRIEENKQRIVNALAELEEQAAQHAAAFSELSTNEVISDALTYANASDPALIADIKLSSKQKIIQEYKAALAVVKEDNNALLINNEEAAGLINSLTAARQAELVSLVSALIGTQNNTLTELIDDVCEEAAKTTVNYIRVTNLLQNIRRQLKQLDITNALNKIVSAIEAGNYGDSLKESNALKTILTSLDADTAALVSTADSILKLVQVKTTNGTTAPDISIQNALSAFAEAITAHSNAQISEELDNISNIITTNMTQYDGFRSVLNDATEASVEQLLEEVDDIIDKKAKQMQSVDDFTDIKNYADLPFGEATLKEVWCARMSQDLMDEVTNLSTDITTALVTSDAKLVISARASASLFSTALNLVEFKNLFNEALIVAQDIAQSSKREILIDNISKQIGIAPEIMTCFDDIKADATLASRNATLCYIVRRLSDSTAIPKAKEKRELIQKLKTELSAAIDLDTRLVNITAAVLCPHILLPTKYLPELNTDPFYDDLETFVLNSTDGLKQQLITVALSESQNAGATDLITELKSISAKITGKLVGLNDYLAVLDSSKVTAFKTKLAEYTDGSVSTSLLSGYDNLFSDIRDIITSQQELITAKACNIFARLDSIGVGIFATSDSTWVDAADKPLTYDDSSNLWKYDDGVQVAVSLKRDLDGCWSACSTDNSILTINGEWRIDDQSLAITDDTLSDRVNMILNELLTNVIKISQIITLSDRLGEAYTVLKLEEQLLEDIRTIDKNRIFYYNVPVEANVAIDFNDSDSKLNTLMNPAINYDINNVNNSFVISKLDINYLTRGLQIARSSRI